MKTERVYLVPEKIIRPVKPMYLKYDASKSIMDKEELIKVQKNAVFDRSYKNQLNRTIDYYEQRIDALNELKNKNEIEQKKENLDGKTVN